MALPHFDLHAHLAWYMVSFSNERDDVGVYHRWRGGPYGMGLLFRGTREECERWAKENLDEYV